MRHAREKCIAALFVLAAGGLGWRAYPLATGMVQAVMESEPRYSRTREVREVRGQLLDREGNALHPVGGAFLTVVEPQYFTGTLGRARVEALLGCSISASAWETGRPVTVVSDRRVEEPGITQLAIPGQQPLWPAEHLLGYLDRQGGSGLSGLEARFDSRLSTDGSISIEYRSDAAGHTMGAQAVQWQMEEPSRVENLSLTLDSQCQQIVTEAVRSGMQRGCALLLDARTGDILAMESMPAFDPLRVEQVLDSEEGELVNRALQPYAPGSVFKLVVTCAALENGMAGEWTTFDCSGSVDVGGVEIGCSHKEGHGTLTLTQALAHSCNPYFIQLAQRLGADTIVETAEKLGFGQSISLGEALQTPAGQLPEEDTLSLPAGLANFSIGQGDLLATPLQVASFIQAIANGGTQNSPQLLRGWMDEEGNLTESLYHPQAERVFSQETAQRLTALMREVMTDGTGQRGEVAGLEICGKSSSAQAGEGRVDGWFAGFWPMEQPRYVLVVVCEEGGSGSGQALAVFREIAQSLGNGD
ncbi:MAG: peptidoglycan D,D-transpeptidase FtsI family protein [Eubacteriales bacterium]